MAECQNLINQIANLELENHFLLEAIKTERIIFAKAKQDFDLAMKNTIIVDNTQSIQARNRLINELNIEILNLTTKLESSNKTIINLTKQNTNLLNELNS